MRRALQHPILLILLANLLVGIFTFQHYGLSWDEPLFYNYADSIRIAYTPQAFQPGFDFEQVYGRSSEDHKYYGPAYLLIARPIQQAFTAIFHLDMASAWHLVNFLSFQLALYFFYRLLRRWAAPWPAAVSTVFFATQPVFWGHAFINPKDIPFMAFFLAALTLGLEFIDQLGDFSQHNSSQRQGGLLLAGISLGMASAIRVIGPLAGVLIFFYFLSKKNWRALPQFIAYGLISVAIMLLFWPYLWTDPLARLLEVLRHMSDNPTELAVLFLGQIFRANEMPHRYLLQMLALTLTEPTWPLFALGILVAIRSFWHKKADLLVLLGLPTGMLAYLVIRVPAMYDGFRHFFFMMPPVFIFAGLGLDWLFKKLGAIPGTLPRLAVLAVFALPGLLGIISLHPYEYTYYNSLAGDVFRQYETDYWLTCYKDALSWVRENAPERPIYIQREFELAAYYGAGLDVRPMDNAPEPGSLMLFSTRANLDQRSVYRKLPVLSVIGRNGAEFCIVKENR
jgi:hypothetical protein